MKTYTPSVDEYAILQRVCVAIRCHRDENFRVPYRTTERVQERYVMSVDGIDLTYECYAHGLQALASKGWFYVLPHSRSETAHGALTVHDMDQWKREIVYLKMRYA